jgi:hypothetical protein
MAELDGLRTVITGGASYCLSEHAVATRFAQATAIPGALNVPVGGVGIAFHHRTVICGRWRTRVGSMIRAVR